MPNKTVCLRYDSMYIKSWKIQTNLQWQTDCLEGSEGQVRRQERDYKGEDWWWFHNCGDGFMGLMSKLTSVNVDTSSKGSLLYENYTLKTLLKIFLNLPL